MVVHKEKFKPSNFKKFVRPLQDLIKFLRALFLGRDGGHPVFEKIVCRRMIKSDPFQKFFLLDIKDDKHIGVCVTGTGKIDRVRTLGHSVHVCSSL